MTAPTEDTHAGLERLEEKLSWVGLAIAGPIRAAELAVIVLIVLLVCPPLAILTVVVVVPIIALAVVIPAVVAVIALPVFLVALCTAIAPARKRARASPRATGPDRFRSRPVAGAAPWRGRAEARAIS